MSRAILMIDDEPNLLHALARQLRSEPYEIYTARSAEEAIDILKSHPVDLMISDENMPGMCGTDLLAWTAEHLPEVVRISLTGQPSVPTAMRAINEGQVFRFLTKPCDVGELASIIREGLAKKEAGNLSAKC